MTSLHASFDSRVECQGGFSLADLLVGLALVGLLAAAVLGVYQVSQNSYLAGAARSEVQESARVALHRMATEVREAGYDPTFAGVFPGLTAAAMSDLTLTTDFDEDGILDANETVRYYLSAADSTLHRSAGGADEVLIDGVQTLTFTFLDGGGNPTATVANVRTIRMLLTTRPVYAQAVSSITTPATFTTEIQLRNTPIP
jgi:Tfp pilus assembly protein PilW